MVGIQIGFTQSEAELQHFLADLKDSQKVNKRELRVIYAQLVQIWHLGNIFKQLLSRKPITGTGTEIGDAFRVDVLSEVATPQAGSEKVAFATYKQTMTLPATFNNTCYLSRMNYFNENHLSVA